MCAATRDSRSARPPAEAGSPGSHVVLIISSDAVAAALLGGLVETLGFLVRFFEAPEAVEEAIRRTRPSVAMVDCHDPTLVREDLLGRARMRGISVVIFGTPDALHRVRELAMEHQLDTLIMPVSLESLDEALRKACGIEG